MLRRGVGAQQRMGSGFTTRNLRYQGKDGAVAAGVGGAGVELESASMQSA